MAWLVGGGIVLLLLVAVAVHDLAQKRHSILRNFPVVGHLRFLLEAIGPELRQYIVTDNDEERPFSRDQRRWVYASAKRENDYFGFGTDNDIEGAPTRPTRSRWPRSSVRRTAAATPCGPHRW
jgi:glutamate synthase domain-containing protein 2